jgi:hypothetical protein
MLCDCLFVEGRLGGFLLEVKPSRYAAFVDGGRPIFVGEFPNLMAATNAVILRKETAPTFGEVEAANRRTALHALYKPPRRKKQS